MILGTDLMLVSLLRFKMRITQIICSILPYYGFSEEIIVWLSNYSKLMNIDIFLLSSNFRAKRDYGSTAIPFFPYLGIANTYYSCHSLGLTAIKG